MFSFDERGNVLIDSEQSDAISRAASNRTISARATALSRGQYQPVAPINSNVLEPFISELCTRYRAICTNLRGGATRVPTPRGVADITAIGVRAIGDWVSVDLQGFEGPLPIMEMEGVRTLDYLFPADGAVIRYLGRLLRKSKGLIAVDLVQNGDGRPTSIRTLDASEAVNPNGDHIMRIRVALKYSEGIASGRLDAPTIDSLKALLKVMDIQEELPSFMQVLRTLSRKLRNDQGTWGEKPRFPVVNFRTKTSRLFTGQTSGGRVPLISADELFHGNSPMYADKSVYEVLSDTLKSPLISSRPITTGGAPWTIPQAQ